MRADVIAGITVAFIASATEYGLCSARWVARSLRTLRINHPPVIIASMWGSCNQLQLV